MNSKSILDNRAWQWITLLVLAGVWGSSFILMKKGLEVFPFEEVGALRLALAFLTLIPFGARMISKIDRNYWPYLMIVGIYGNGMPAFLFAIAQTRINSSLAGMLNALVPMFTLLIGLVAFHIPFRRWKLAGVLIGLIGAAGLLMIGFNPSDPGNLIYASLVVFATICYAISVNVIKHVLHEVSTMVITSLSLLFVGPFCIVYLLCRPAFIDRLSWQPEFLQAFFAIVILGVFGTALALMVFNHMIKRVSALFASSVTYLIPIVAIAWGFADGEAIHWLHIFWITVILTGVYLINKDR